MILKKSFYNQETIELSKKLLGKVLVNETEEGITSGMIVETESYLGIKDPASHGHKGYSNRIRAMFGDPGHAYIYFTYGMYYCFNVTAAPKGICEGILIRALQPIKGIEIMEKRRKNNDIKQLCNGPAKLVLALGITKELYEHDLTQKPLYIEDFKNYSENEIVTTTRVGISHAVESPLRFYVKDNIFISKR